MLQQPEILPDTRGLRRTVAELNVKWSMKTAADRTSPGRIYRHFSGWKFSQFKGA